MGFFRRNEVLPAGLEIGAGGVKLVQVVLPAQESCAVAAAHRPLPASLRYSNEPSSADEVMHQVRAGAGVARSLLQERPFRGRKVVAALPDELVQMRTLRVVPDAEFGTDPISVIRRVGQPLFPFSLKSAQLQYWIAGSTGPESEARIDVIVAATPLAHVDAFVRELDRAGLRPVSLELAPMAAFRAVCLHGAHEGAVALLHLGPGEQSRVSIGVGAAVRFSKSIGVGAATFRLAVASRLGLTPDESAQLRRRLFDSPEGDRVSIRRAVRQACRAALDRLVEEVAQCLRYDRVAFRGQAPRELLIAGCESRDPQLHAAISAGCGVQSRVVQPIDAVRLTHFDSPEREPTALDWAVSLGLAIRTPPSKTHSVAA